MKNVREYMWVANAVQKTAQQISRIAFSMDMPMSIIYEADTLIALVTLLSR